ncbi:MAG: hypothetical protein QF475_01800, partial [Candidatus Undinarchaeales archaeon]|nr:hypothetical protein [Candidatus Undinarchaeales archaeon]
MEEEVIQKYKQAGEILKKAQELAKEIVKPGAGIQEITDKIEAKILKDGGKIGFPLNVSINEN